MHMWLLLLSLLPIAPVVPRLHCLHPHHIHLTHLHRMSGGFGRNDRVANKPYESPRIPPQQKKENKTKTETRNQLTTEQTATVRHQVFFTTRLSFHKLEMSTPPIPTPTDRAVRFMWEWKGLIIHFNTKRAFHVQEILMNGLLGCVDIGIKYFSRKASQQEAIWKNEGRKGQQEERNRDPTYNAVLSRVFAPGSPFLVWKGKYTLQLCFGPVVGVKDDWYHLGT